MAEFEIEYRSKVLASKSTMTVLLPDDIPEEGVPVLYLLHGMDSDHKGWQQGSRIHAYARKHQIAVVMADAQNSYYTDQKYGYRYGTFFTEELPVLVHKWFHSIRMDPKHTYIAGLSMGGYGALRIALSNPERFAGAVALSSVADLAAYLNGEFNWHDIAVANWGEDYRTVVPDSEYDLFRLIDENERAGKKLPALYIACGTEDHLLSANRKLHARLSAYPDITMRYEESAGAHTWDFWDTHIEKALRYVIRH